MSLAGNTLKLAATLPDPFGMTGSVTEPAGLKRLMQGKLD